MTWPFDHGRTFTAICASILCVAAADPAAAAAKLGAHPLRGPADEPFKVRIEGARSGAPVRVQAAMSDEQGQTWTAVGEYTADDHGVVDSAVSASTGGTYLGVSPGGLTCSMLPVPKADLAQYVQNLQEKPGRTTPLLGKKDNVTVTITAEVGGRKLPPLTLVRDYLSAGVTVTEVDAGRVQGLFFEPAGSQRGIPVVVLGGSGGGIQRADAALLASRGHPALALAYFGYKGLPAGLVEIPLETFADGAAWLKAQTGARGVVLMGASRGSEAVELTAAYLPESIAGIIAIAPSPLVHGSFGQGAQPTLPAWTIRGRGIPSVQTSSMSEVDRNQMLEAQSREGSKPPGVAATPSFLPTWMDSTAHLINGIPVERINVPMLLLGGEADAMWPSALGVQQIRDRMATHGKAGLVEAHVYPGAGHLISRAGLGSEISSFLIHPMTKTWVAVGGEAEANCRASYDVWTRIRAFLGKL